MSPTPNTPDFNGLVNDWLIWLRQNRGRSVATVDAYQSALARLSQWCREPPTEAHLQASTRDPLSLGLEDLERFTGMICHHQGLSARSRRVVVSAIRGFYAWAAAKQKVTHNPAAQLPYPRAGRRLPRILALDNADKLLRQPDLGTFRGLRDATVMAMLMGTGLRISGLVQLNESALIWTDFEGRDELVLRVTEKGEKERMLPVPREAALLLRAYLGHPDLAEIDRALTSGDSVLFVSTRNHLVPPWDYRGEARRLSEYGVRDLLHRHGRRAGIPDDQLNPHAVRHLYGTELAESDVDLLQRQSLLGHASPDSTAIYTHLAMRKMRETVRKSNPLGKLRTPLLDDLRRLDAAAQPRRVSSVSTGPDKS